jgi:hypothetical protein
VCCDIGVAREWNGGMGKEKGIGFLCSAGFEGREIEAVHLMEMEPLVDNSGDASVSVMSGFLSCDFDLPLHPAQLIRYSTIFLLMYFAIRQHPDCPPLAILFLWF